MDDIEGGDNGGQRVRLAFDVLHYESLPFSAKVGSRATELSKVCTKLSLAVYQNGKKVREIDQSSEEKGFGHLTLMLSSGAYQVVIVAHSSDKKPVMTDPEKIRFKSPLGDVFYYYQGIQVGSEPQSYDISLKRAVAMFRLIVTDPIPERVTTMYLYMTGGSICLDAVHGTGCTASKQGVNIPVTTEMRHGNAVFEVYTIPRQESQTLSVMASAMNDELTTLYHHQFEDVPVLRNRITQYKGKFFDDSGTTVGGQPENGEDASPGSIKINLITTDEWTTVEHSY